MGSDFHSLIRRGPGRQSETEDLSASICSCKFWNSLQTAKHKMRNLTPEKAEFCNTETLPVYAGSTQLLTKVVSARPFMLHTVSKEVSE
jgi:hypothetical protein